MIRYGIDTGGTFTDFVIFDEKGHISINKILSTPKNPAHAVIAGIKKSETKKNIIHGSTVATNALLEHKGVSTAFITTEGFEDLLFLGRQNRLGIYDLDVRKPQPLIKKQDTYGVEERTGAHGEILHTLNEEKLKTLLQKICDSNYESVAICLLHSYANASHEKKVKEILLSLLKTKNKKVFISLSSEILPEYREYERASTTVINAYVSPLMNKYISFLEKDTALENATLRIMQSNGGSISARKAKEEAIHTVLSGPAGGVVGAVEVAQKSGYSHIMTFDMGGTSTDVSLVPGELQHSVESVMADHPIKVPIIDIHTVGAGGGSIAYQDTGGAFRVGPMSAGADPGPICYGKGDSLTVTDANLFLGRLHPDFFLGGKMKLVVEKVDAKMKELAQKLTISPVQAALGILEVVNSNMQKALRVISVQKGFHPKDFALVCFGGAGGLHAVHLAHSLSIPRVLIPKNAGVLSAFGMLLSDIVKAYSHTKLQKLENLSLKNLKLFFSDLESQAQKDFHGETFEELVFKKSIDMRYTGQSYEIKISYKENDSKENLEKKFHEKHHKLYGYSHERSIELVTVRLHARGTVSKPKLARKKMKSNNGDNALIEKREIYFSDKVTLTPVYNRDLLESGARFAGPALIVEHTSTSLVPPGFSCFVNDLEGLEITDENRSD